MSNEILKQLFSENLRYWLRDRDRSQADLSRYMKVSSATASDWCHGNKMPRTDKIQAICSWLGIELADLLEERRPKDLVLSPEERSLVLAYRVASDERKKLALLALGIEEKKDETASA